MLDTVLNKCFSRELTCILKNLKKHAKIQNLIEIQLLNILNKVKQKYSQSVEITKNGTKPGANYLINFDRAINSI